MACQRTCSHRIIDDGPTAIAGIARRQRCEVLASIVSVEVSERPTVVLDVVVDDGTGRLVGTFFGRREMSGFYVGRRLRVERRLVRYRDRQCLLNATYELVDEGCGPPATSS